MNNQCLVLSKTARSHGCKRGVSGRLHKLSIWAYYLVFSLVMLSSGVALLSSCSTPDGIRSERLTERQDGLIESQRPSAALEVSACGPGQEQSDLPSLPSTNKWVFKDYVAVLVVLLTLIYTILIRLIPTSRSLDFLGWVIKLLAKLIPDRVSSSPRR